MTDLKDTRMDCAWKLTALSEPPLEKLSGNISTDFLIVGAGYAGLNVALKLSELEQNSVVIDAQNIGHGASGRNGGQVVPGLKYDPSKLIELFGERQGGKLIDFAGSAADATFNLIKKYALDCDAKQTGWLQPVTSARSFDRIRERAKDWHNHTKIDSKILDQASVASMLGTDFYVGGWIDPRGGQLQPLSYVRELARVALKNSVKVFCQTPATSYVHRDGRWFVSTPNGTISAKKVFICTNGYTGSLVPELSETQIVASSIICATAPLPPSIRSAIMPANIPVSDGRRLLRYMRFDSAGRFLIGARGSFGMGEPRGLYRTLMSDAVEIFPDLEKVSWEHAWSGRFSLTKDHLPHIHELADGLLTVTGCNGRGVAMMTQLGRLLAEIAVNHISAEDSPITFTKPEKIGFRPFQRPAIEILATGYRILDKIGA